MPLSRRALLALSGAALTGGLSQARAQTESWYALTSDDGKPVPNLRLPVELTSEVDELPGLIRVGSARRGRDPHRIL